MSIARTVSRLAAVAGVVAVAAWSGLHAQQAQPQHGDDKYQPRVGQTGKDVVWVPTPQALVDRMLDMAQAKPGDYVIDLGSGDGRTVITAAKRGMKAHGIEYNPEMVELAKRNAAKEGVGDKVTFVKADIFESDFSQATVLTLFLLTDLNIKLRPIILKMKPGTRVVSNSFGMGDWTPDEVANVTEGCSSFCRANFWIVPADVNGRWKVGDSELAIEQKYQKFTGKLTTGNVVAPITDGKLKGDEITFTAAGAKYTGKVTGSTIQGTRTGGPGDGKWTATRN
jgi:SAM-dependent methyltransferase